LDEYEVRSGRTLNRLWRRKTLITCTTLTAIAGALWFAIRQPQSYQASAQLVVRPVLPPAAFSSTGLGSTIGGPLGLEVSIETQAEIARSRPVAERVAQELGLAVPPTALASSVTVTPVTTELLEIEASAPDPQLSAALANGFARQYLEYRRDVAIEELQKIANRLQAQADGLDDDILAEDQRIAELTSGIPSASRTAQINQAIEQRTQLALDQGQLEIRVEELATAGQSAGGGEVSLPATPPSSPSSPQPLRDSLVGGLLGLALGAGVALVREHVDRRVETRDEAASIAGAPVLANVPARTFVARGAVVAHRAGRALARLWRRGPEAEVNQPSLGLARTHDSKARDAYSALLASLQLKGLGAEVRRLLVVSSVGDERVPDTVAGLGLLCAERGLRTLALGANLRSPTLHAELRIPNEVGLAQLLMGRTALRQSLVKVEESELRAVPAGSPVEGAPAQVLGSPELPRIMKVLSSRFDAILIEGPPASMESDVSILASVSDAALLVVRARVARPGAVARTVAMLERTRIPIIGVAFHDADRHDITAGLPPGDADVPDLSRPSDGHSMEGGTRPRLVGEGG
jgi:capsular exopolysaccharide synthesis family protein